MDYDFAIFPCSYYLVLNPQLPKAPSNHLRDFGRVSGVCFEIVEIWPDETAAKLHIRQYRHVLGRPTETVVDEGYGLMRGERIELAAKPWVLILEQSTQQGAQFRVTQP